MTLQLASLGMYDGGALTAANDEVWSTLARRLIDSGIADVPLALERTLPLETIWSSGRLLFGHTCGYPFAARYRGRLQLVATPEYRVDGCADGMHRSFVIVSARSSAQRLLDLRGTRAGINETASMTGRHLLGDAIASEGGGRDFFGSVTVTGSHAASVAGVARGEVDVAAIDCVSYALLARAQPELVAETRVIHRTRPTPSLPFVISAEHGPDVAAAVARALAETLADPATEEARRTLLLAGTTQVSAAAYDVTRDVATSADPVLGQR